MDGLDPRFFERLAARSARVKAQLAESLREPGAHPLVLGVFQKRNHCGGRPGLARNLAEMVAAIETAGRAGVQMLAMPEMALQGYFTPASGTVAEAQAANRELAVTVGASPELAELCAAARTARMVVAFGFGERAGAAFYNSIGLIDADGAWLGVRRKNPLYPWDYESRVFDEPAPEGRCAVFNTRYARVGLSDCFDGEFPETIRAMALAGAQVLLWCNAPCGDAVLGTTHRFNQSGAHAQTNGLYVACASCVAPDTTGMSNIFSPVSEPLVVLPPDVEALGVATVNLAWHTDWSIWRRRLHSFFQGRAPG